MKKLLCVCLVLVLSLSFVLTGCSNGGGANVSDSPSGESPAGSGDGNITAEAKAWKCGFLDTGTTDATNKPLFDQLKLTIEALNGEVVTAVPDATGGEGMLAAIQNLISSGVDGVILNGGVVSYGVLAQVAQMCDGAGVYWSLYWCNLVPDTDDYKTAYESEYFISNTYEDDVYSAYFAMNTLGELGCKNVCEIGLPGGMPTTSMRDAGIEQAIQEHDGMKILAVESDVMKTTTSAGGADITSQFLTAFPETDAIIIAGMTQYVLPGVIQALEAAGKAGQIKIAAIDFQEYQYQYMEEGKLSAIIGGHFSGPAYSAILMANVINGTPLTDGPISIEDKFIELATVEEAKRYEDGVYNGSLYTADEIKQCLKVYNPDFTIEDLIKMADSYSLDDIISRHS